MCQISINSEHFQFGGQLGLAGGKYLIKIIFNIKVEIEIFEISHVLSFNKFKYIDSSIKLDNNGYNQKLPHIYVMTKWMANKYFLP